MEIFMNSKVRMAALRALEWESYERKNEALKLRNDELCIELIERWERDFSSPLDYHQEVSWYYDVIIDYNDQVLEFLKQVLDKLSASGDFVEISLREIFAIKRELENFNNTFLLSLSDFDFHDEDQKDGAPPFLRPFFKETSIDNMERQLDSICTIWEEEMECVDGIIDYIGFYLPKNYWDVHYVESAFESSHGWYKVKQPAVVK